MTFFNKKEDVIQIELTPHGRKLLSEGKLMPYGYSFFDDDIIYESQKGGGTENNTNTKTRILVDTPSIRPQSCYKGVETEHTNQLTNENDNLLLHPIGTNKPSATKVNAWDVTMIRGEISASSGFMSSSSPIVHIPQIECEINYEMSIKNYSNAVEDPVNSYSSEVSDEGNYLLVEEEQLLMNILEKNGFSYKDSLNVEVYLFSQDEATIEKIPFIKTQQKVVNDMFVEDSQQSSALTNQTVVSDYFYLFLDKEINTDDICQGIKNLKDNDIYLGLEIECEDVDIEQNVNIYQTSVTSIEDCEV